MGITFIDRTSITFEEAAQLIEDEGKVGGGAYMKVNGLRCSYAIICGLTRDPRSNRREVSRRISDAPDITNQNDLVLGESTERRCKRMTAWFRTLHAEEIASE